MSDKREFGQREYMRKLVSSLGRNRNAVVAAYAKAERDGIVHRAKNSMDQDPDAYALALWLDGDRKGWF
jgi:hypothetical protein